MKILLFCAKAFETMEFSVFVDVFGWARDDYNVDIQVETCGFTKEVRSTFNIPIMVDKTIDEISVDDYDALAIPGGFQEYGFYEEAYDQKFLNLIKEFDLKEKIIASVCVAALPIAKSGILKGRNATTYHPDNGLRQQRLREYGVNVINEPVVIDKNIITSYCPQTAPYVAFALLEKLAGKDTTLAVRNAMGYECN